MKHSGQAMNSRARAHLDRKVCCLCGREGHRSSDCPMRDPCKPFSTKGEGVAVWFGLGALLEVVAFAIASAIPWGSLL